MSFGQEGDTRQYPKQKSTDYYATKSAFETKPAKQKHCLLCKRVLEPERKSYDGYCLQCYTEPK